MDESLRYLHFKGQPVRLIGISGKIGAGKTTLAHYIQQQAAALSFTTSSTTILERLGKKGIYLRKYDLAANKYYLSTSKQGVSTAKRVILELKYIRRYIACPSLTKRFLE